MSLRLIEFFCIVIDYIHVGNDALIKIEIENLIARIGNRSAFFLNNSFI